MNINGIAKILIKKPLNKVGLDIVRLHRSEKARQFGPSEATRFIWLSSLGISTVIDIGAHTGEFVRLIHNIIPQASIISFEPLKEAFQQLEADAKDILNFTAFNCALGDINTKQMMHRNEFKPSSSLLKMAQLHKTAFPFTECETIESVEIKRLDDVLEGLNLENNILVKIDVQGYEDKVLLGGKKIISRSKLLIVEASFQTLYEGQPLFDEIYCYLKEQGFKYIGNLDQLRNPFDGRVLQADAIFLRQ